MDSEQYFGGLKGADRRNLTKVLRTLKDAGLEAVAVGSSTEHQKYNDIDLVVFGNGEAYFNAISQLNKQSKSGKIQKMKASYSRTIVDRLPKYSHVTVDTLPKATPKEDIGTMLVDSDGKVYCRNLFTFEYMPWNGVFKSGQLSSSDFDIVKDGQYRSKRAYIQDVGKTTKVVDLI